MVVQLPSYPSQDNTSADVSIEIQCPRRQWYFSRQELEHYSPSRKDGIEFESESELRKRYCSFIQELGMELKVPQVTIATAMMLCHRFYMRQSHAKNDWQTVASVCVFLACKNNENPRWLCDVTVVAYKLMFKWDPSAPRRIKQKDVYEKQKELMLIGERILLTTIAYDFNIELPYKPLVTALKSLEISNKELYRIAWNFVNDWTRTMLCLQYKADYIAAGSMFLAARFQQVKLPTYWWMHFDVAPKQLEEVTQDMLRYLGKKQKPATPLVPAKVVEPKTTVLKSAPSNIPQRAAKCSPEVDQQNLATSSITQSCLERSAPSNSSDCGSGSSMVEDGDGEPQLGGYNPVVETGNSKIDINKIREAMKRRRQDKTVNAKIAKAADSVIDSEAWIEMELENGIDLDMLNANKRIKI